MSRSLAPSNNHYAFFIPARYGSTRFPGKALALLNDKPILQWVIEGVQKCSGQFDIIVATDDSRIQKLAESLSVDVVMTSVNCQTGTDRIYEALVACEKAGRHYNFVINVQGDEPLVSPVFLNPLVNAFTTEPALQMATLAHPLHEADVENKNAVKVVLNDQSEAIYFSRYPIPYSRQSFEADPKVLKHVGLYGYSSDFLKKYCSTAQSFIEKAESLEQLRALSMGARIKVLTVNETTQGVDTPEDLAELHKKLSRKS